MNDGGRAGQRQTATTGWRWFMHNDDDQEDQATRNARTGPNGHVVLPREAQGRIGQQLRRVYGEILAEPLPDKFSQLLGELAKAERSKVERSE